MTDWIRSTAAIGICAGLAAMPALAHAQQAVVRSYDAPELEVGQAWLMHVAGRCYAVMPNHVTEETSVPSLLREGARGLRGEASDVANLGDDAAIAPLSGAIEKDCGYSVGSIPRGVERKLRDEGLGTLRFVNGDGTLGRLAVTVVDDDGTRVLRVMPTTESERIRKGHSGSLLLIGDQPVGMLLSVNARSGIGTVMRADVLLAKVDAYVRGSDTTTARPLTSPPGSAPPSPNDAWQVIGWNVDPVGSQSLASKLFSSGDDGFWAARITQWPAAIEIGTIDTVRIVRGVEFLAGEAGDTRALPARVQVMTSVSTKGPAWRAVNSGTLIYINGVARMEFPPTRARMLRVEIYSTHGAPAEVALGRLRVLEANR